MKAVIMAGGFGTRLRPLTCNLPKPMVPVANRPMMLHIVDLLKKHGLEDLISLVYYQPESIQSYFGDGKSIGVKMQYQGAESDLGTAGSVKLSQKLIGKERFLVISADILTDFDLSAALKFHQERKAKATLVLTRVENPLAFGVVITDREGRITRFLEKPSWGEVFSDTINTGIYILEPEVFDLMPEGKEFDFSKNLFPLMLEQKMPLYGYISPGYWKDIGTLPEYLLAHGDLLKGHVEVVVDGERQRRLGKDVWIGKGSRIDPSVKFKDSVIVGKDCVIGPNASLSDCILGDGCVVGEGAKLVGSVVWDHVKVGMNADVREAVIAGHTSIGDGAYVGVGVVISDHCRVGRGSTVKAEVKMWPHKTVDDGATLSTSLVWGDKWSKNLFDAYGISGTGNIEMTPEFACKLGASYGASLPKGSTVLVSRDNHKTSRMIDRALMSGLASAGINVHDLRVSPIPVARYATRSLKEAGGLHIRRSPYDSNLIDIKFFDKDGLDLPIKREKGIENLFYREDFQRASSEEVGEITFPARAIEYYEEGFMNAVKKDVIRKAGIKIVLDYAFGSASTLFPNLLGALNVDVVSLNAFMDETKLTKTAEEFQAGLKQLSTIVPTLSAHLGVMFDSGGQKIYLSDERGNLVSGDQALVLFAQLHSRAVKEARVAVPVTASRAVEEAVAKHGGQVLRCGTTYRSMMEAAAAKGTTFVGEERGGYMFSDFFPAFDAMMGVVKLMEYLAVSGEALSELVKGLPRVNLLRTQVACSWERKGTVMRRLIEDLDGQKAELVDGVKLWHGKSWVLVLPDADRPLFHVDAEADSSRDAENLVSQYTEKIKEWSQAS
jgi:mannose-1-phosphate guanylyltransferase/phosphomannomutase